MKARNLVLLLLASLLFSPASGASGTVVLRGFKHVQQKPDFCGEACLEMVLKKLGANWDQDDVFNISGTDPAKGRGCVTRELVQASNSLGFDVGKTWYNVRSNNWKQEAQAHFKELHQDLSRGIPSIVCMRYDFSPNTTEHFRLIVGYKQDTDEILYLEPAEPKPGYRRMSRSDFLALWPLKYDSKKWTLIRLRMKSHRLPGSPKRSKGFSDADYAQHIKKLRRDLPGPGFTIVVQKPFVVIGDESPEMVHRRAISTVGWSVKQLSKLYFPKEPKKILNVWLFKDRQSYQKHNLELFGKRPSTPFGFYSPYHGALVMNIATGGGTLVHEIVHPFMESNFEDCPDWFNEGLASLYEQSAEQNGVIRGLTNWRLAGLQDAIRGKRLQSIDKLTTRRFYSDDEGTNYSMARYLCFYLQEKGKLGTFYRQFRKNVQSDPRGYKTLKKVLGVNDLDKFQDRWEDYVMRLRFQ